jgi:hypothetical protein
LPQLQGSRDYLVQLPAAEIEFATEQIIEDEMGNDYQEYFEYARSNMSLSIPCRLGRSIKHIQDFNGCSN